MNDLLAAARFLTVVPVPRPSTIEVRESLKWFPVVGLLIGIVGVVLALMAAELFAGPVAAVLVLVYLAAISGCLHLDGLADTADGLMGGGDRSSALTIMRDSRIGAMGVVAVVSALALKGAALFSLAPGALWQGALVLPLAGRSALLLSMWMLPYARPEGGLGADFCAQVEKWEVGGSIALLGLVALVAAGMRGLAAAAISMGVTVGFSRYLRRRLQGATGDTLGAACEIAEATAAAGLCLYL